MITVIADYVSVDFWTFAAGFIAGGILREVVRIIGTWE